MAESDRKHPSVDPGRSQAAPVSPLRAQGRDPRFRQTRPARSATLKILSYLPWVIAFVLLVLVLQGINDARLRRWQAEVDAAKANIEPAPEPAPMEDPQPAAAEPDPAPLPVVAAPIPIPRIPHRVVPPSQAEDEDDAKGKAKEREMIELTLTPAANHNYYVEGQINGRKVTFLVDTGATSVAIPDKLRWQLDLTRGPYMETRTANGRAGMYKTEVKSLYIGPPNHGIKLSNVPAVLYNASDETVLLGMSALQEVRLTHQHGQMLLQAEVGENAERSARPAPPAPADPLLKRSVAECLGGGKVVDDRVLRCMQGAGPTE